MWLPSLVARLFGESAARKGRPYRNYRGWFGVQRLSVRGLRGPSPSRPHLRVLARFERLPAGRPRARIGPTGLQRPAAPPSSPARTATISVGATLVVALPRRLPVRGIGRPQGAPLQELSRLVRGAAPVGAASRCAGSADRVRPARIFESLRASSACRQDARAPGSGRPDSNRGSACAQAATRAGEARLVTARRRRARRCARLRAGSGRRDRGRRGRSPPPTAARRSGFRARPRVAAFPG